MADSILDTTKKAIGISETNTDFDLDIIMHINSALGILNQLGIGTDEAFAIEDDAATWDDFYSGDKRYNSIRQYVFLKTRIFFDPPVGSYHLIDSMQRQITELEWRLSVVREGDSWVEPTPPEPINPEVIIIPVNRAWVSE